jgi:glutamate formiminotransferase/formiminotetrahydrofolate cyclodeaminase
MQLAHESMEIIQAMAEEGNPNSVSDAGVGALCARSAVMGAYLNVKINAAGLTDNKFAADIIEKGKTIEDKAKESETKILSIVNSKIQN